MPRAKHSRLLAILQTVAAAFVVHAANAAVNNKLPAIGHVFIVVLENESFERSFGDQSPSPYLAKTLPLQGVLLPNYYGIGHNSLDNYVALISGQPPNEETQTDCVIFSEFQLTQQGLDDRGRALGRGCVYPKSVKTLPDQLEAAGLTWSGYMEDMGHDSQKESRTCGHPAIGAQDRSVRREVGDQYATKHNPFVYFHSIIDDQARCDAHVVNLDRLPADLKNAGTTPNYVFVTPNLCNDGHDAPCVDGAPGGLVSANGFLEKWVPLIIGSPAFRKDGVLIVTFDESAGGGPEGAASCCDEEGLPGATRPPGWTGPGGGRIGAVLLSPFIKPGIVSMNPYNHYSLLRSIEDWFGLDHLGNAAADALQPLGTDVFPAASSSDRKRDR